MTNDGDGLPGSTPPSAAGTTRPKPTGPVPEPRLLHWRKTTDADLDLPVFPTGTDVRVLLPDTPEFHRLRDCLAAAGIAHRTVRHWVEDEVITTLDPTGAHADLTVTTAFAAIPRTSGGAGRREWRPPAPGRLAHAARDAFSVLWDAHDPLAEADSAHVPVTDLVPAAWAPYLPFPTLNPAQAHAAPAILDGGGHLVITAPTGAGKTVSGMLAVLRAILGEGRKAAWLVPQRSLTDELDRELRTWRGKGLRVERLSGEYLTDVDKVRRADLWVSTTEKFEAICRASSLQTALTEVGCVVVDEIHLLGTPTRGPLLEALLARVRGADSPVRIVGLSATVSNAAEIAEWLDGALVATTWRPTRLTWQLPQIHASGDRATDAALRTRATVALAQPVLAGGGSVLVFCGSKRNTRATALALAAARGSDTAALDPDDLAGLHRVCGEAGIGLHYKDWPHKHDAERRFRARELDTLVATTTVAAGVNLPARAVIIRDTQVGLDEIDVATVLQMFGRAGRIGAGEHEGWAYLITTELERAHWQGTLVEGHTVRSRIHDTLPDHVLADTVQTRVTTTEEAHHWWRRTLCHHQGDDDTEPLDDAIAFLTAHDYLTTAHQALTATPLGALTTRLMIDTRVGATLRAALATLPVPEDPDTAEDTLIHLLSVLVPALATAPVAEPQRPLVARVLKAGGHAHHITPTRTGPTAAVSCAPGDLARAVLLLAAHSPRLFTHPGRPVAGLHPTTITPVLDQAPRYLTWLAAQGHLRTVHPWVAIVAADLARRVRWRHLAPPRGAGRLLWMCEHLAPPPHTDTHVPRLWAAATSRGHTSPDWNHTTPPHDCQLTPTDYQALLHDRATTITATNGQLPACATPPGSTLTTWTHDDTHPATPTNPTGTATPPAHTEAAVFTKRGDYRATGMLGAHYNHIQAPA